jgi:hypothetical protein
MKYRKEIEPRERKILIKILFLLKNLNSRDYSGLDGKIIE